MAKKKAQLTPSQMREVRRMAKEEAIRIVTEGSRLGASPFLLSPVTRPFVGPLARGIPAAANVLLKSGALDPFINAKINELAAQRNIGIGEFENKSRQEILFDLAEAGLDILNDPDVKKELENLESAARNEGSTIGLDTIRRSGQFARQNIVPNFSILNRRTRKKTKTDKNMSKALAEANSRLRTKKGKLRKGKTQADVMRLAHRIRKKMK